MCYARMERNSDNNSQIVAPKKTRMIIQLFYFGLLVGFLTQVFIFACEYLKYQTVQQIDTKKQTRLSLPAITFCDRNLNAVLAFRNSEFYPVNNQSNVHQSNKLILTKRGQLFCVTFFSHLHPRSEESFKNFNNLSFQIRSKLAFGFITKGRAEFLAVHSPLMPPQTSPLISAFCWIFAMIIVVNELLKPPPYDTKCDTYLNSRYYSKWDCEFQQKNQVSSYSDVYLIDCISS